VAQIVLMRELMVVSYGNEISLGVMLASWLLWTAFGSGVFGRLAAPAHDPGRMMASLQVVLALTFPATVLAVRASRSVLHATPGEILGPVPMLLTCLLTLSGFCAVSGCLFTAGSRLYARHEESSSPAATSAVYLLEAAGSALGGILASLALVRYLTSMQIALLVSCLNVVAAVSLAMRTAWRRRTLIAVVLGIFVLLGMPLARRLETISLARLWPGFRLVAARNSVYGNLAVVETPGSRSLFENGLLMFNAPDPAAAEEAVHFALLQHPDPRSLLLIGGGASGSLLQALQHPSLERVDYVELDPAVLDLAQQCFPQQWLAAQADPRVFVHHADGRLFLKSTDRRFDVILTDLPDPQTAQLNRFYTLEFFREAAGKLKPGGVFAFQLHAAEEYISPELGDFLRCINKTLRQAFPFVSAIPGESVHFFAAMQSGSLTSDPQELISRLRSRHIQTRYVREYYIPFRMMPDRMLDLEKQLRPRDDTPVNRDFAPIAYYFDVALWSTQFNQSYRRVFESVARVNFGQAMAWIALLLLAIGAALRWLPRPAVRPRASAVLCTGATGFTLIGLEVLLLLGFQAIYGYVYHQLAIVIAFFMAGMALGSWWSLRGTRSSTNVLGQKMLMLAGLQIVGAASPLLLYGLFVFLSGIRNPIGLALVSQVLFPVLALLSGLLGGYQFPLASGVYFAGSRPAASLGTLYAVDLVGACLGALAVSALLLPVFGFLRSGVLIAAVNLAPGLLAAWVALAKAAPQE
jgi:spermidine synthase